MAEEKQVDLVFAAARLACCLLGSDDRQYVVADFLWQLVTDSKREAYR